MIKDLTFYSENFLKILTKKSQLLPFCFNPYQFQLAEKIKELKKENKPIRIIVLKCRQIGISTWGASFLYHETATNFYKKSLIIADDQDNSSNLFNMCKRFYDYSPDQIKPLKRYSNEKALVFENPDEKTRDQEPGLMSSISIQSAQKLTAGRSGTIQCLHCSEFAFWPHADIVTSGLFQSVPLIPESSILIESTANGVAGRGEQFYIKWKDAESKKSDFVPIFFNWLDNQEYWIDPGRDFKPTDEEKELMKMFPKYNNDLGKLAFRRYKINNEMGSAILDPESQFKQEYPHCAEEAFIASGRPVFNQEKIIVDIDKAKQYESLRGTITGNGEFVEDKNGDYVFYEKKIENKQYAIGADVAEGLETGDFSAMFGIDHDYNQTFSYCSHIAPDLFGKEMCRVGKYFNNALIAPEVNNHGHTTLSKIKDLEYYNIYTREVREENSEKLLKKIGWQTNVKTKTKMLDDFVALYRDDLIKIKDVELLKEMLTLTVEPDGSVVLNSKDRVVAACIAAQAIKQVPREVTKAFNPEKNSFNGDFLRFNKQNKNKYGSFD